MTKSRKRRWIRNRSKETSTGAGLKADTIEWRRLPGIAKKGEEE